MIERSGRKRLRKGKVTRPIEVVATGLGHPEGPCPLDDGRIVFANTYASEVAVWAPGTTAATTFAFTGGGPNACMVGTDGCIYVTQCPTVGAWVAPERRPPSIQRITPDGTVEIVATDADGLKLTAPNDLTFGPDGRLYFTDSGDWDPVNLPDPGYICVIDPDGSCHVLEELAPVYPNGIVAEPDGSIVWVESYTRRVVRRRPDGSATVLAELPERHIPDGLKIDAAGNLWITTFSSGGLDILSPDGEALEFVETGGVPLNCVFDGTSLFVCDFGTTDTGNATPMSGRLLKLDAGVGGLPLYRGAISQA
jgi:gluconolactonase